MASESQSGSAELAGGRVNQKKRTRNAILQSARTILDSGTVPTVAEAADAALVGRTTAYRYFPTQNDLLLNAAASLMTASVEDSEKKLVGVKSPQDRFAIILAALHSQIAAHETMFRTMIRLSLERADRPPAENSEVEVRFLGHKRLDWAMEALQPVADQIPTPELERLTDALAALAGAEVIIALKDSAKVQSQRERFAIVQWMTRQLIDSTLAEAGIQ